MQVLQKTRMLASSMMIGFYRHNLPAKRYILKFMLHSWLKNAHVAGHGQKHPKFLPQFA